MTADGQWSAKARLKVGGRLVFAVAVASGAYLIVYGPHIKLDYLVQPDVARAAWSSTRTASKAAKEMIGVVYLALIAMVLVSATLRRLPWTTAAERAVRRDAGASGTRRAVGGAPTADWPMVIGATAVTFVLMRGGSELAPWLARSTPLTLTPGGDDPGSVDVLDAVKAAVGEEIIVVAIPIMILRYFEPQARTQAVRRLSWMTGVVLGLVAMRVAYHLYQGTGVVWLVPWAVWTAWAFWRWRHPLLLVGLIAAHFAYNASAALPNADSWRIVMLIFATVVAAGTFIRPASRRWIMTPAVSADPNYLRDKNTAAVRPADQMVKPDPGARV